LALWNCLRAASVAGPNTPSTPPATATPWFTSACWRVFTASPWAPRSSPLTDGADGAGDGAAGACAATGVAASGDTLRTDDRTNPSAPVLSRRARIRRVVEGDGMGWPPRWDTRYIGLWRLHAEQPAPSGRHRG